MDFLGPRATLDFRENKQTNNSPHASASQLDFPVLFVVTYSTVPKTLEVLVILDMLSNLFEP